MRLQPDDDIHFLALYQAVIGWHAGHRDPSSPIRDGDSFRAADVGDRFDARDRFVADPDAIDAYLAADPDDLCESDRELVHPWRNFVSGDLVVARELADHTIFLAWTDPPRAYAAVELFAPIRKVLRKRPPLSVEAALFPWRGGIVCDGVFSHRKVRLDPVLRREIADAYREAEARGIVTSLATEHGVIPPKRRGRRPLEPERRGAQWIGGIGSLPVTVIDDEDPYPPDVILWLDEHGAILDKSTGNRLEALGLAADGLFTAITKPRVGRPRMPSSVRVASAPLARLLRKRFAGIEVVRAPTPEIDALVAKMRRRLEAWPEPEPTYLVPGTDAAGIASFFHAAAELFRAAPHKHVPSSRDLFAVTIEALGVHDAAVSIVGQRSGYLAVMVFADADAFAKYIAAGRAMWRGVDADLSKHLMFDFLRGGDLDRAVRKEIAAHGWVVAQARAHPWLTAVDEDDVSRLPTGREVAIAEGIARALVEVIGDGREVARAWLGSGVVERTVKVRTGGGAVMVVVRAPYAATPSTGVRARKGGGKVRRKKR